MEKSIIFLDFDGVLNTEQHQMQLAVTGRLGKDLWGPLFSPTAVVNLRKILDTTDARIVISSSWRCVHGLGGLRMMWDVRELPGELHATLPCEPSYLSRGEEIENWLNRHNRPNYVIMDDLNDFMPSQYNNYVEVNPVTGITEADTQKAIAILNQTCLAK